MLNELEKNNEVLSETASEAVEETQEKVEETPVASEVNVGEEQAVELSPEEVEAINKEVVEDAPTLISGNVGKLSSGAANQKEIDMSTLVSPVETFKKYKESGEILWCTVSATTPLMDTASCMVQVEYNGTSITIVENQYFEDSFEFGGGIETLDPEVQKKEIAILKNKRASAQLGATVPVIITDIVKSDNEETVAIIGSRKKAMSELRNHYFLSGKFDIKKGDIVSEAHVLAVAQDYVIVECLGVETRMDAYSLSYQNIHNCKKHFHPGDVLKNVTIRKFYANEGEDAYLTLTARTSATVQSASVLQVGSSYLGTISFYNKNKKCYSVVLEKSHLSVTVYNHSKSDYVYSDGTRVFVTISKVYEHFAVGFITGL